MPQPRTPDQRRQAARAALRTGPPWGLIALSTALALALGGVLAYAVANTGTAAAPRADLLAEPRIDGVDPFAKDQARSHTEGEDDPVDYPAYPPTGGEHNPIWQSCGVYDAPVRTERAVHSMEHGAVWLSWDPDAFDSTPDALKDLARGGKYVLVAPALEKQPAPVIATAWGLRLETDDPDDPRLEAFVDDYERGPQTPEPGATCGAPGKTDTVDTKS